MDLVISLMYVVQKRNKAQVDHKHDSLTAHNNHSYAYLNSRSLVTSLAMLKICTVYPVLFDTCCRESSFHSPVTLSDKRILSLHR